MRSRGTIAFVAILLAGGASVAAVSLLGPPPRQVKRKVAQQSLPQVTPAELAEWILSGRRDFVVVDVRPDRAYQAGHIRNAVHCSTCHESKAEGRKAQQGEHFVDLTKKIVLYDSDQTVLELPPIVARNPRLYALSGGWAAWQRDILAPVQLGGETDRSELEAKQRREAVRSFFAGERPGTGTLAPLPITPVKRENAHTPAGKAEGC